MRRVLDARLSARALPSGLHGERIQWLYDGLATATPCPSSNASPSSPSGSAAPDSVQTTKKYLLYWMQTSVRAHYNYALEYAVAAANALALPLHVVYMLSDRSVVPPSYAPRDPNAFGVATERHAKFALEGLACVANKLQARGLSFQVIHHHHERTARSDPIDFWAEEDHDTEDDEEEKQDSGRHPTRSDLLDHCARDAALVITDRPYLRPFKDALMQCVEDAQAKSRVWGIVQVEGDVVVPCEQVTNKEEYAARTIRPKVTAQLKKYLVPLDHVDVAPVSRTANRLLELDETLTTLDVIQIDKVLQLLDVDRSVQGVSCFLGGEDEATRTTQVFLKNKLARYATDRNEPSGDGGSNLSLYLRHGHVSPVSIALAAQERQSSATKDGLASFLEEMIVRRELAVNLCVYNDSYDTMNCLPEYATITLHEHADDRREHLYNVHQLERGETFDAYWNAAQREMAVTGRMHGYMRMYWCKKILEWTIKPELGFRIALYLNNKYALDAPDPNSYTGVAWSFGKHDQGWKERPIFGKVRYMNEAGLKRKFHMDAYVSKIQRFEALAGRGALENATVDGVVRPTNADVTKTTKRNVKDRATNDQDDGKASTKRSKRSNKQA